MGLIYSSSDSAQLIQGLKSNIQSGKETVEQLKSGSQKLVSAVDGKTLSGAAYTAGKGLFTDCVIPTINRTTSAFNKIEQELSKYQTADAEISGEGYLDEDNLRRQIAAKQAMKRSVEASAAVARTLARTNPVASVLSSLLNVQSNLRNMSNNLEADIQKLKKKLDKLGTFSSKTSGLFSNSSSDLKLTMQGVLVLNSTTINADGTYSFPEGIDISWFNKIQSNANSTIEEANNNAFLELYKQVSDLLDPLTSGKTDNMKRMEMLLAMYPAAVVKKLLSNEEFWSLADKLSPSMQTKLINGLAKFEDFGEAVASMKWIPKVNTLGKGYEWFGKLTSPFKTLTSTGLKNIPAVKALGKAGAVFTFAELGIKGVSSGVNEYGKTGSIGKGIIGGGIDAVKSVGPLEGMTIGASIGSVVPGIGTGVGAVVGGVLGLVNTGAQFINPNLYSDLKDGAYNLYDKSAEVIGKGVTQSADKIKTLGNNIINTGKTLGKTLSDLKVPKISLGW